MANAYVTRILVFDWWNEYFSMDGTCLITPWVIWAYSSGGMVIG
jgi:hypothetical protein